MRRYAILRAFTLRYSFLNRLLQHQITSFCKPHDPKGWARGRAPTYCYAHSSSTAQDPCRRTACCRWSACCWCIVLGYSLPANVDSTCDEPGSSIVCILTSRPDVLSAIVRHVRGALERKSAEAFKWGPAMYIKCGLLWTLHLRTYGVVPVDQPRSLPKLFRIYLALRCVGFLGRWSVMTARKGRGCGLIVFVHFWYNVYIFIISYIYIYILKIYFVVKLMSQHSIGWKPALSGARARAP